MDKKELLKQVLIRLIAGLIVLPLMFFIPAGTLSYWPAWVYMAVIFTPMFGALYYLYQYDPGLLERRMHMREKEPVQKQIILVAGIVFVGAFIVPGLDWRWGWSQLPAGLILFANGVILLSYFFLLWVFKTNSYASRIIEVEQNQPVISTGPYAIVRHPMYLAILVLYGFSPLALGSYWAMLPTSLVIFVLIARIQNEELVLRRDLPGYIAYTEKIKYRLIPGVW